ncbi:hypothetical protein PybrP1_010943 [[Pythium] brassicae (nom. inval.)]|nr:hypothetical protein PybrP1_010943 [[Pythium] brassicae (nom. inval.)]
MMVTSTCGARTAIFDEVSGSFPHSSPPAQAAQASHKHQQHRHQRRQLPNDGAWKKVCSLVNPLAFRALRWWFDMYGAHTHAQRAIPVCQHQSASGAGGDRTQRRRGGRRAALVRADRLIARRGHQRDGHRKAEGGWLRDDWAAVPGLAQETAYCEGHQRGQSRQGTGDLNYDRSMRRN